MAIVRALQCIIEFVHTHTHTDKPDLVEDGKQLERPVDVLDLGS